MTPISVDRSVSLWQIEDALVQLVHVREEAETEHDKAVADAAIEAYVKAEVRKVDGILAYLRSCQSHAAAALAEAERIHNIARMWTRREERLKEIVLSVMRQFEVKRLEGQFGDFIERANPPSVEITDISLVPDEFCQYEGRIGGQDFTDMMRIVRKEFANDGWRGSVQMERVPMKAKIVAAIKAGEAVAGARLVDKTRLVVK